MTGSAVSPRPRSPLRVFKDRAAAEAEGLYLNPGTGIVYRRYGADPAGIYQAVGRLRTDLETELASVLAAVEWRNTGSGFPSCALCDAVRPIHERDCALKAALRAFNGEE